MKLKVTINSTNAAFDTWPEIETSRLLREIADKVEQSAQGGPVIDINGNKVGEWSYRP